MCLFCQIINKEIKSNIVYEDEKVLAFRDINPQALTHILVIPKKHLVSTNELVAEDVNLMGELIYRAKILAQKEGVAESGYRLVINSGPDSGQIIEHIHLHLLGGQPLGGIA